MIAQKRIAKAWLSYGIAQNRIATAWKGAHGYGLQRLCIAYTSNDKRRPCLDVIRNVSRGKGLAGIRQALHSNGNAKHGIVKNSNGMEPNRNAMQRHSEAMSATIRRATA